MDFTNRGAQQPHTARSNSTSSNSSSTSSTPGGTSTNNPLKKWGGNAKRVADTPQWLRVAFVTLLFSLTVLAVSVAALLHFGSPSETKFLGEKKVQAIFLTNGQVYFGNIKEISGRYVNLQNIYYLNSQEAQPSANASDAKKTNNFSLVKLGCELHGPYDQMVVNREQVVFWENLRDDGQVVKAIKQWQQENPNGQTCKKDTAQSNSTNQSAGNDTTTPAKKP